GAAFGRKASVKARDIITTVKKPQAIDEDVKKKLAAAAKALAKLKLDEGDKTDVTDDLTKLRTELEKPDNDEGRILKIWNRIKDIAPTVALILAPAASLAKILGITP